jgi:hypothetical protein
MFTIVSSTQELDLRTAEEIRHSISSGVLANSRNSHYDRMIRKTNCDVNKTRKCIGQHKKDVAVTNLKQQLVDAEKAAKDLREQIRETTGRKPRAKKAAAESSSSGRAPTVRPARSQAQAAANPYPAQGVNKPLLPFSVVTTATNVIIADSTATDSMSQHAPSMTLSNPLQGMLH